MRNKWEMHFWANVSILWTLFIGLLLRFHFVLSVLLIVNLFYCYIRFKRLALLYPALLIASKSTMKKDSMCPYTVEHINHLWSLSCFNWTRNSKISLYWIQIGFAAILMSRTNIRNFCHFHGELTRSGRKIDGRLIASQSFATGGMKNGGKHHLSIVQTNHTQESSSTQSSVGIS